MTSRDIILSFEKSVTDEFNGVSFGPVDAQRKALVALLEAGEKCRAFRRNDSFTAGLYDSARARLEEACRGTR